MLKHLHIENIAVIEKTDIEFGSGLNILTGETGAGKSIVIDSINAILGQRTSRDLIRSGCDRASVTAVFSEIGHAVKIALEQNGVSADENDEFVVTKILSSDSKSSIRINGQPISSNVMRGIAASLINIHGQHDNQALLDPETHCEFVDLVANNKTQFETYYECFKRFNSIRKQLQSADNDEELAARRKEMLTYKISELESANILPGEIEDLRNKIALWSNSEKILKRLRSVKLALSGNGENDGATAVVLSASADLLSAKCNDLSDIADRLSAIGFDLSEISEKIDSYIETVDFEPAQFEEAHQRLEFLKNLSAKYSADESGLLSQLASARAELETIHADAKRIEELEAELNTCSEALIKAGQELSESRKIAATAFCKAVSEVLSELDMPDVVFIPSISQGRYTKSGCDEIEFMISANRGESAKPLAKIASGGELSRVMLGIKSVLAGNDPVSTLIFDEIDTGISGRAALKIAVQLKKLAKEKQILCVTHLAQIAAAADTHLLIEKSVVNDRAATKVCVLDESSRLNELSRIIGSRVTEANIASAEELMKGFD